MDKQIMLQIVAVTNGVLATERQSTQGLKPTKLYSQGSAFFSSNARTNSLAHHGSSVNIQEKNTHF